jgi:PAS domain S-box-containing protein
MNTANVTPLLAALEELAPPDHLCSIYESADEHFAVAMPFIRIGLERREKCVYIADDGTEAAVRDAMHAEGIDVERAVATGSLVLEKKETAYLKHGSFDPNWMFTFWGDATAEARSKGYTALRVTGETEWVLRGAPGLERWMEYESRMTHMLANQNCVALCQYNGRLFPPELILDVIRTHPTIIYRGVVCRNMYYVPPDEFLGTNKAEREVERLLTNIRDREEVEYTVRQQRDELRDSEALFRQIAETVSEVFWVLDLVEQRFTFISPMYEELFGRSCASLYANSRSHLDAIHPDDRARVDAAVNHSRAGETSVDERFRIIRPDGSMRWIRARSFPVPNAAGPVSRIVGISEDITDQRRAEEQLERSERLLRLVLDAMPVGVIVVDRSGDIVLSNPASQRIWGGSIRSGRDRYAESKAWWHATGKRLAPTEWASVRALVNGETTVNEVVDIEGFGGVRKTIQNSAVPIRGTDDSITGAVVVNEDVTGRKTAERELSDSYNQMRALTGRLMRAQDDERRRIAQMLHETTAQDLAGLKMLLARLKRSGDRLSDGERDALAESISLAEQSMTEIRTLSYLLHPPFLDENGLLSALRWYATGFAERSGIAVDVDLPESFERLPRDTETALFRIVQESLINIHRHAESETAAIRLRRDDRMLVLEIEDRGHGISKPALSDMMHGGGVVGVGLAGMSERIEQLGGTLDITSNTQGTTGTTVRVRLPLPTDAA